MKQNKIAILDLGSEDNSVLARKIRAMGVYSEIYSYDVDPAELTKSGELKGIILSGGANTTVDGQPLSVNPEIFTLGVPVGVRGMDPVEGRKVFSLKNPDKIRKFVFERCGAIVTWNIFNFIEEKISELKQEIGNEKVILALSGGVDSSVVAALLYKAIGSNLTCVHVNHGLLRKGEPEQVIEVFGNQFGTNLVYVDAQERFLSKLKGVSDPEEKRKIIGAEFIRVFEEEARKLEGISFLAQGTIYPDIVESGTKTAKKVKSHHNVGGLPDDLNFKLIEPLKYLFKDEVRACGKALGLPTGMINRQPFPGPGLGVRCLGEITPERLEIVRESDAILREEFSNLGLDRRVWQYFTVVPDFKSTGVRDGGRSYEYPVIIRAVNTVDAMTATVEPLDYKVLARLTERITTEVKGVNRVVYDVTPKPVATIEWE